VNLHVVTLKRIVVLGVLLRVAIEAKKGGDAKRWSTEPRA
jgi:hypothetical protein